jgi:molybdopterin synthase sulfur carrier subunit
VAAVVHIPTPLRRITNGKDQVSVKAPTLLGVLDELETQFPGLKERLCDSDGELHRFVNIYLNGEDVRFLRNLDTEVKAGDEISIVPAVAGGSIRR